MLTPLLTPLLDLLLPTACAACGRPGAPCCAACRQAGAPHVVDLADGLRCHAAGPYAPTLGRLVVAYKERGRRSLRPVLTDLLGAPVAAAAAGRPVVLVGVPASAAGRRERGFDHVADVLPRPWPHLRALRVVGRPADSAHLGVEERAANLAGSLAVRPGALRGLAGRPVVVVDDVVTTGATLRLAAEVLAGVGAEVVGCAAVAATVRRLPRARPGVAPATLRGRPG